MQFHATHFPFYESGNANHELANNGSWFNKMSTQNRLEVVLASSLVQFVATAYHTNGI
jgi:hypothetical protein